MANLTYRQATQVAPSSTTTKNAPLTSAEIDGNLKSLNDELVLKAPLASPALTGTPTAPTATAGTNTTQIATTAFVIAERSNTATLTNKTLALGSNSVSGTLAQFNTACSDADFASLAGTETITNKTIALGSNTVSGTLAQFNTACTDADFVSLAGTETLTNKTINGSSNTITNVSLTAGVTGTLPIANGGTNATTAADARTNLGLGSAAVQAVGTAANDVVQRNASGYIPVGTNWTCYESAGVLYFAIGGVAKAKLDASGNLTVVGNVTAYGTM